MVHLFLGKGTMVDTDGTLYKGEFKDGVLLGKRTVTSPDGWQYEGEFRDGILIKCHKP
jgi:hypothetical protein